MRLVPFWVLFEREYVTAVWGVGICECAKSLQSCRFHVEESCAWQVGLHPKPGTNKYTNRLLKIFSRGILLKKKKDSYYIWIPKWKILRYPKESFWFISFIQVVPMAKNCPQALKSFLLSYQTPVFLCFTLLYFTDTVGFFCFFGCFSVFFVTSWRLMAILHGASLLVTISQQR